MNWLIIVRQECVGITGMTNPNVAAWRRGLMNVVVCSIMNSSMLIVVMVYSNILLIVIYSRVI